MDAARGAAPIRGRVLRLGDDVSTDLIYPARHMALADPAQRARHVLEGLGPEVQRLLPERSIVVAGWNMGCGSSREHAATALREAGVQLVIARSFSRLFFRNGINTGLPLVGSEALADALADGDEVAVALTQGLARTPRGELRFAALPPELASILADGGLLERLRGRFAHGPDTQ